MYIHGSGVQRKIESIGNPYSSFKPSPKPVLN